MGYTTEFSGSFKLDRPLSEAQRKYLAQFAGTRRMKRREAGLPSDPLREAVNLPIGRDCQFFVGGSGFAGQDRDESIVDYNYPPDGQPGLWCQWVPNEDGTAIEWDGGEKFYSYTEWLKYIIENFLKPWGHTLNGKVHWRGEEFSDLGTIVVKNNAIQCKRNRLA